MDQTTDERFMALALDEARRCVEWDDVPVGCVIVRGDEVVASAGNGRERHHDPTAHAEVLALRDAAAAAGTWRLARVDRVVFGASDPKAGFAGSLGNLLQDERLNHRPEVTGGVLADECGHLLRSFFRDRR